MSACVHVSVKVSLLYTTVGFVVEKASPAALVPLLVDLAQSYLPAVQKNE